MFFDKYIEDPYEDSLLVEVQQFLVLNRRD